MPKKNADPILIPFVCPQCGAVPNGHGKGHCQSLGGGCLGFICECEVENGDDHGQTFADPCTEARCFHCKWAGTFPIPPKGLTSWEKKALDAGWAPPAARAAELGLKTSG